MSERVLVCLAGNNTAETKDHVIVSLKPEKRTELELLVESYKALGREIVRQQKAVKAVEGSK